VRLGRRSTLVEVAMAVGDALRRQGIRAVLTGGACASLHCDGAHASVDVDLVLLETPGQVALDEALATLGFHREADHYAHPRAPFIVEFPPGPLGIGNDLEIRPVMVRRGAASTLALSATDSCRDRLAAFYHWNDRQSLRIAAEIAVRKRIDMDIIEAWSRREGRMDGFEEFGAEVGRLRAARRRAASS
jgi:hypothetical protein